MKQENESAKKGFSRREFVAGILPVTAAVTLPGWASAGGTNAMQDDNAVPTFPGMITREKEPLNLEFPFPTLKDRVTSNGSFFIRGHFPMPKIDRATWKLVIAGEVTQEITFSYNELLKFPSKKVMVTLECAGNGRANLAPKVKGLLWEQGAVGNAEWTGVPLFLLLEKAGVKAGTVEIILEGADEGEVNEEPKSPGKIKFARSLPLAKAMQSEVLIAYQMNGKDLEIEHGYPVRAIIPGWYGMASVKWLAKITATAIPYEGYWQTLEYAYWKRKNGLPTLTPVREIQIKSEIARPALHEIIPMDKPYRIHGAAWAGESSVKQVEISTDRGNTWSDAKLLGNEVKYSWRLWEFIWNVPDSESRQILMTRATDSLGNIQPIKHDPDRRNYMVNAIVSLEVFVQ